MTIASMTNTVMIFLLVFTASVSCLDLSEELETHRYENITKAELKFLPPIVDGKPVEVSCSMYFLDVRELDSKNMKFSAQFYFRQAWTDTRVPQYIENELKLKPAKKWTFTDLDSIWKPDTFVVEEINGKINDLFQRNSFLRVESKGTVFLSIRISQTLRCDMNFSAFPHDKQNCALSFETYGYNANQVDLQWAQWFASTSKTSQNPETYGMLDFYVDAFEFGKETVTMSSGNYSRVYAKLHFHRKIGFFLTKLYIPFILLVMASGLSFWISYKLVALRLSLLLSILFVMVIVCFEMSSYMPQTSYVKAIDIWTGFCLAFVFGALLEFIYVSQRESKRKRGKADIDVEVNIPEDSLIKTEKDCENAEANASTAKFIARNFYHIQDWNIGADVVFRYAYPALFGVFNLVYWCVYVA